MVNCGMLLGVTTMLKRLSLLAWFSNPNELPKERALAVAHFNALTPALLCLRALCNCASSGTLKVLETPLTLQLPALKVRVTAIFLFIV